MDLAKLMVLGLVPGALSGAMVADMLSGGVLKAFFGVVVLCLALLMLLRPAQGDYKIFTAFGRVPPTLTGVFVGIVSALTGIGGASLNVPYMSARGVPIHRAIGTAALLGLCIAVPGCIGFIYTGQGEILRPPVSIGFVNLPAWAAIVPVSVLCAPLGAWTAHKIQVGPMRTGFALLLVIVAFKMMLEIF